MTEPIICQFCGATEHNEMKFDNEANLWMHVWDRHLEIMPYYANYPYFTKTIKVCWCGDNVYSPAGFVVHMAHNHFLLQKLGIE